MPARSDDALKEPVDRFVAELAPVLEQAASRVATINAATLERDVVLEAFNLATAFIDTDGLHTDDELLNLLIAFGPRLETVASSERVSPTQTGLGSCVSATARSAAGRTVMTLETSRSPGVGSATTPSRLVRLV